MRPKITDDARRVPLSTTIAPVTAKRIEAEARKRKCNKGQVIDSLMERGRK